MRGRYPPDTIPTPFPPRLQIATSRKSVQRNVRVIRGGPPGGQWVRLPIFFGGLVFIHMLRNIYQHAGPHGRRYHSGYHRASWVAGSQFGAGTNSRKSGTGGLSLCSTSPQRPVVVEKLPCSSLPPDHLFFRTEHLTDTNYFLAPSCVSSITFCASRAIDGRFAIAAHRHNNILAMSPRS
jgi:hypothetical protein